MCFVQQFFLKQYYELVLVFSRILCTAYNLYIILLLFYFFIDLTNCDTGLG